MRTASAALHQPTEAHEAASFRRMPETHMSARTAVDSFYHDRTHRDRSTYHDEKCKHEGGSTPS